MRNIDEQPYKKAFELLLIEATNRMDENPSDVIDFNVPAYYEDKEGHISASYGLINDAYAAYVCALVYHYNNDKKLGNKAENMIMNWAITNKKVSGYDGPLVMAYAGTGLVLAANYIKNKRGWKRSEKRIFTAWLRGVFIPTCELVDYKENNWGDWGTLGIIAAKQFLEDPLHGMAKHVTERLERTIDKDTGEMVYEVTRGSNGITYSYFSLAPITRAIQLLKENEEEDLYGYKDRLEKALKYLFKYRDGTDWPHDDNPKPLESNKKGGNLYQAMGEVFNKQDWKDWAHEPMVMYPHNFGWVCPLLES